MPKDIDKGLVSMGFIGLTHKMVENLVKINYVPIYRTKYPDIAILLTFSNYLLCIFNRIRFWIEIP